MKLNIFKKKNTPAIRRILVIRFSSIGDIVLTTPVIRALKRHYPQAELHFLVKQSFRQVILNNPYINTIHTYEKDINATITSLKAYNFDFVADLQKNFRSRKIAKALGTATASFPKLNIRKWLYTNFKVNTLPDKSIVDRYFQAVKKLKTSNDGAGLDYFIPEKQQTAQDDIPMSHWAGFAGCVIGGSFATKKFPVHKWIELIAICPYPVILLGGPDDRDEGNEIAAAHPGRVYNACGKFNLNESADLVRRAKVIISNDTGLMHIAAAYKKPIVSLWGNTTPHMGMFPYYGFNNLKTNTSPLLAIEEVHGLSCRPCSKLGYAQCPKKHFRCMNDIDVNRVAADVEKLWKI